MGATGDEISVTKGTVGPPLSNMGIDVSMLDWRGSFVFFAKKGICKLLLLRGLSLFTWVRGTRFRWSVTKSRHPLIAEGTKLSHTLMGGGGGTTKQITAKPECV